MGWLLVLKEKKNTELLEVCRRFSGEYLPGGHPKTSFATTYSDQFVEAATELYERFQKQDRRRATILLYIALRDAEIPSCRGGIMDFDKTDYLVKRRISSLQYERSKES